tara:strand:+ start:65 stop:673 length:609 start_codon:yes stop_codon:yes gene_type:complete
MIMLWVKRFFILCSPLWFLGFILFYFDFIPNDFRKTLIFIMILASNLLLLIFGKKYKKQKLKDVKINWKDSWQWVLFYLFSIYFGLTIGHFITAGIDREKIGVMSNAFDIEHSFLMTNDDLSVGIRCANPNTLIDFIAREREESYYIINWRKYGNFASTNKIDKSGNIERGMEMLGMTVEKNDWVKPICDNGWDDGYRSMNP